MMATVKIDDPRKPTAWRIVQTHNEVFRVHCLVPAVPASNGIYGPVDEGWEEYAEPFSTFEDAYMFMKAQINFKRFVPATWNYDANGKQAR
jgi:hypothetical protein